MADYCWVYGVIHFTSPAGWLPVHRDQPRAQRSITSTGKLYLFYWRHRHTNHALRRSASPGLTATGFINWRGQFLTPRPAESTPLDRSPKKSVASDYVGDSNGCVENLCGSLGFWAKAVHAYYCTVLQVSRLHVLFHAHRSPLHNRRTAARAGDGLARVTWRRWSDDYPYHRIIRHRHVTLSSSSSSSGSLLPVWISWLLYNGTTSDYSCRHWHT